MIWNAKNRGISYTDMSDKEFLLLQLICGLIVILQVMGGINHLYCQMLLQGLFIKLRKYSETDIIDKVVSSSFARICKNTRYEQI